MEAGDAGSSICRRNPDWDPGDLHVKALRFEFFGATCFGFNVAAIASGSLSMGAAGLGGCAGLVEDAVISWTSPKLRRLAGVILSVAEGGSTLPKS